jgi:peptidoglycan L-alanyl-D-glutamate endopeptidase CwlK
MPLANFARINLDQLYLPFLMKLLDVIAACSVVERTTPRRAVTAALESSSPSGPRAARAPAGASPTRARRESPHNYGLAVDLVRMQPANTPDWQPTDYAVLGEEAERAGLVWGGGFNSLPRLPHMCNGPAT